MLHPQTLLSFSSSSSSPSNSLSFFHLPYTHSSQLEKERRLMEFSLSSSTACINDYENTCLVADKNDVVSVDEYLADEYFLEIETEDRENETHQKQQEGEGEGKENMGFGEGENSLISPWVLTFEAPPPLSELTLPTHDIAELEWVSIIMDESLSEIPKAYESLQLPSKIKVDGEAQPPPMFVPIKAKRSKRSRTLSSSWSSPSSSSSSATTTTVTSSASSSSFPYSQLILAHHMFDEIPHPVSKPSPPPSKKRGRKPKVASNSPTESRRVVSHGGDRRCSHCGVNKTPQWRAGPHGAKTLCNACGVRFKSGRLLPEYRPACSPTFISHVHSNSHRRVLEMRRKKEDREADKLLLVCSAPPVASF